MSRLEPASVLAKTRAPWRIILCGVALVAIVFVAYFRILSVGFVGDDWIFYELAGRLSLPDYLVKYFDPRVQTAWYRPVQGVLFRLGYQTFGSDPSWYHLVNVIFHAANSLLLFALVTRTLKNWRVGFLAGLLFATLPLSALAVFWAGVIDPVTALFTLLAIWFWLGYLQSEQSRDYWLAFCAFVVALLTKEIAVTLPVILLLFERYLVAKPIGWNRLFRRYIWFGIVWIGYVPLEYIVVQRSVFVHREGYQPRLNLLSNLVDYLSGLAFPWYFAPPLSYAFLLAVLMVLGYLVFVRRARTLIPVVAGAVLYVLPVVLFPQVSFRFAYCSMTVSAVLFALLLERVWSRVRRPAVLAPVVVAAAVVYGAASISTAAADYGEFGRVSRVPFRNVRQAHPTFPEGTLVYFINPPLPGPNLSGMFFWYYGPRVQIAVDDTEFRGRLRDYAVTYVEYFDQGEQYEQAYEKQATAGPSPALPARFVEPVVLEEYELVSARVARGRALLIFLYWRALGPIADDYTVFVHLVDQNGAVVAGYDKEPRRGVAPTSTWRADERIVDAVQVPVGSEVRAGRYKVEVGLYNAGTGQRVGIVDATGTVVTDRILIEPVSVVE